MKRPAQFCTFLSALLLAAAVPGCATYRKCGLTGCPGDARITGEVRRLLEQHPALEPPNLIYVQTLDRVVYLTGQVNTGMERELAASIAFEAVGVTRVENSIATSYEGK